MASASTLYASEPAVAPQWWPTKYPDEDAAYVYDVSQQTSLWASVTSLSVAIAPHGAAADLTAGSLGYSGSLFGVTLTEGVPTQTYALKFSAYAGAFLVKEWVVEVDVGSYLPSVAPVIVAASGFGPPAVWNAALPLQLRFNGRLSAGLAAAIL